MENAKIILISVLSGITTFFVMSWLKKMIEKEDRFGDYILIAYWVFVAIIIISIFMNS